MLIKSIKTGEIIEVKKDYGNIFLGVLLDQDGNEVMTKDTISGKLYPQGVVIMRSSCEIVQE